jgi:septal ring factor EnvC (AmiA/AmiB activator)
MEMLNELKQKLEELKKEIDIKEQRSDEINEQKDELEDEIEDLSLLIISLEDQKNMKKNPSGMLKPIKINCLKKYALFFVFLSLLAEFFSLMAAISSFEPVVLIGAMTIVSGLVDYGYNSKEIRNKIKHINLAEIEYALDDSKNRRYEKNEQLSRIDCELKEINEFINEKSGLVYSLNQDINAMGNVSLKQEQNKQLVK